MPLSALILTGCSDPPSTEGGDEGVGSISTTLETGDSGDGDGDGDPGDGDGDGDPGDGDGDGDGDIKFDLVPPDDGEGGGGSLCSDDLKQVLDENHVVIENCEPGTACYEGECIEMCVAAGLSKGSIGCEYYVPTPPFYANQSGNSTTFDGSCHALMIANSWDTPAELELSFLGQDYDYAQYARIPNGIGGNVVYDPIPPDGLPPGQVAILFLSHNTNAANGGNSLTCPVPPALVNADAVAFGTSSFEAWEVVSDTPVTVYDILPYGGASTYLPSASLLQPRTAWGENYVIANPHATSGYAWILAVAREDNTTVSINVSQAVNAGTIMAPPVNTPTDYVINAGETLQWMNSLHLAGSIVQSDKPIGIYSGNTYLRVSTMDVNGGGQDSAHQQLPHVQALASEYVGPGIPTRKSNMLPESVLYHMVGMVDGTELSYDPAPPAGAPAALGLGEVVEFQSTELFTIRSQDDDHPFSFTQYMAGAISPHLGGCLSQCTGLGDEEWINLVAPAQYMRRYVFFVDPTYGVSSLAIVRTQGTNGFEDVELDCYGVVDGWMPVGNEGLYEVAHIDLYRGGVGQCAQSQQEAWSVAPFGIIVWGVDHYASYGYPAGGNARTINDLVVPVG
ncbi:IgGFc-binding protein [Enhygromyxa salina]|uniref:IgGFc-binding protein n=1 Tax=Enhygromyxa salina TaxID=215803 RepID=UPI0015E5D15C|nr:IgGFc-binding protein [Enhygromyxa salina]